MNNSPIEQSFEVRSYSSNDIFKMPSDPNKTPKNIKNTRAGIPSLLENLFVTMQDKITIAQNKIKIDILFILLCGFC